MSEGGDLQEEKRAEEEDVERKEEGVEPGLPVGLF